MILVDTSVLIRHFRSHTHHRQRLIETISLVVCGISIAEFRAGARTPAQLNATTAHLAYCGRLPTPESICEPAGRNQAHLAANGLIVQLFDTVIATVAIDAGLELWTYDAHFTAMASLPGLRLYHEPP